MESEDYEVETLNLGNEGEIFLAGVLGYRPPSDLEEVPRSQFIIGYRDNAYRFRFSDRADGFYMDVWSGSFSGNSFDADKFLKSEYKDDSMPETRESAAEYAQELVDEMDYELRDIIDAFPSEL